ncbi:MAG: DNA mismatch endonuclease Vsr [Phycisphaerales bacterium]|nr:DNA mismatch endonuclease Vsr [Phycisphaerales bacterium]
MADTLSPAQRRRCMAAIRSKDTKPELIVRSTAHRLGFRFRLHAPDLPGKPDLVFRSRRAVIFVHGCYWHMHGCKRGRSTPTTNVVFWKEKRSKSRERDQQTIAALRRDGWRVLIVWECELRNSVRNRLIERLSQFLTIAAPLPRSLASSIEGRRTPTRSRPPRRVSSR